MNLSKFLIVLSISGVMAIAVNSKLVTAQTLPYSSSELEEFLPKFEQLVQQYLGNLESREQSSESLIVEIKSVKSTDNDHKKIIIIEAEIKRVIHSESGLKPQQSIHILYEKYQRPLIEYPTNPNIFIYRPPHELIDLAPPDVYEGEIIQVFLQKADSLSSSSIYILAAGSSSFEWNIQD